MVNTKKNRELFTQLDRDIFLIFWKIGFASLSTFKCFEKLNLLLEQYCLVCSEIQINDPLWFEERVLALDTMYFVLHVLQDRRIVLAKLRSKISKETKFTKTRRQVLTAEEMLDEHSVCFRILVNLFFERSPVEDWMGNSSFLGYYNANSRNLSQTLKSEWFKEQNAKSALPVFNAIFYPFSLRFTGPSFTHDFKQLCAYVRKNPMTEYKQNPSLIFQYYAIVSDTDVGAFYFTSKLILKNGES